ncbi:MAG: N-(5'-phosphoribosyl)anthranilate isomerase [Planctomycetes bacterium SM23_32]|nr:MAG: N-(5'-phosphoribosyl)anthranilate isomerase [Planctomycetes bacterium SM23_32]
MVKVKICGITNATDALMAASAGADALGFNFWPHSPRYVPPEQALPIRLSLPPFVAAVGLFVDAPVERIREVADYCGLDYVQLHGRETPRKLAQLGDLRIIKAIRISGEEDLKQLDRYRAEGFLLDTYVKGQPGGTGQTFDWSLARQASHRARIILAGGLTPENVADAVRAARPYGVDVASGVEEAPGKKSRRLVTDFIRAAKSVDL